MAEIRNALLARVPVIRISCFEFVSRSSKLKKGEIRISDCDREIDRVISTRLLSGMGSDSVDRDSAFSRRVVAYNGLL